MPTDTYREEAKGVFQNWYVYPEKIPNKRGIRINEYIFRKAKECLKKKGVQLHLTIPFQDNGVYNASAYFLEGVKILLDELLFDQNPCTCKKHAIAKSHLMIRALDERNLTIAAEKLGLPLEARIE